VAIKLTITVADITATIAAGYTYILVYRSTLQASGFYEISTLDSQILLVAGTSSYIFTDATGTTKHWYTTTFYDGTSESTASAAFMGDFVDNSYSSITYPEEADFTEDDFYVVDRIRLYIGDQKEITRDYVSATTGYDSVSEDGYTYTLSNPKGWPVKVVLDGVSYTTLDEPTVEDYQFITFSGVQINTTSGTLDVWYSHFRFSDIAVLTAYNGLTPPYPLSATQVTFELEAVTTAIDLLSAELRLFGATSSSEVDIYQEIRINPGYGYQTRLNDITDLKKKQQRIIDDILNQSPSLYGVRID